MRVLYCSDIYETHNWQTTVDAYLLYRSSSLGDVSNYNALTRNLQNVKDKHADQPAKHVRHVSHPRVASVEPPWLEKPNF